MKKFFSLIAAVLFAGSMMAESETLTCSAGTVADNQMSFATSNFTIVHAKGTGSNFASYSPWRVYSGNTITITGNKYVAGISKIELVHSGSYFSKAITSTAGEVTMATANGGTSTVNISASDVKDVTLTIGAGETSGQDRFSSITITYVKAEITDPEIAASDKDFGVIPVGFEKELTLSVEGMNLTQVIVASLPENSPFEVAGELTAAGGTLTITAKPTVAGNVVESLTLTAGEEASTSVELSMNAVATVGDGTEGNPFTCADLVALDNAWAGVYWAAGYIVANNDNDLRLADNAEDEEQVSVQLAATSELRTALNPVVGMRVLVKGSLEKYYSLPGLKSLEDIKEYTATALDNTAADAKAVKFFENGQLIILKNGVRYNTQGAIVK